MVDYQFMSFQDLAPLRTVGLANLDVPTLDIRGKNFSDVTEVLINGYACPEFVVVSRTRVLAEIPLSQRSLAITSVQVRTSSSGRSPSSLISFDATVNRRAEGWLKLAQTVLKVLLTTRGSDIFNKDLGGGLYSIVGATGNAGDLISRASLSVQNTQSQVLRAQAEELKLPAEEKLKVLTLLDSRFDTLSATLSLRLQIAAMSGTTSDLNLSL